MRQCDKNVNCPRAKSLAISLQVQEDKKGKRGGKYT